MGEYLLRLCRHDARKLGRYALSLGCGDLPMSYTPVPAGGIEPPHDGATTSCLPTWLSRQMMVAEAGLEPAADEAYETPALPTELFRDVGGGCPS